MLPRLFIFLFPILLTEQLAAQQKEFLYKNLTQEEGLPSNEVYYIFRDSKEYLWIATDKGVVRYNGSKMERFELPDNVVFKIYEDDKNRVWFFTHTGILSYYFNGKIFPYKYNRQIQDQISNLLITNAHVDSQSNIWLNSAHEKNYILSNTGNIIKENYQNYWKYADTISITEIFPQKLFVQKKRYTFGYPRNLYINFITDKTKKTYLVKLPFISFSIHYSAVLVKNKYVFLFLETYLIRIALDGQYKIFKTASPILCIEKEEKDGIIYLGTTKGALILSEDLMLLSSPGFLTDMAVTAIICDNEGGLWFSTLEKGLYCCKNTRISHINNYPESQKPVYRIFNSQDTALLFATAGGIYKQYKGKTDLILAKKYHLIFTLFANNKTLYVSRRYEPDSNMVAITKSAIPEFQKIYYLNNMPSSALISEDSLLIYSTRNLWLFNSHGKELMRANSATLLNTIYKDLLKTIWAGSNFGLHRILLSPDITITPTLSSPLLKKGVTSITQFPNGIYCIGLRFGGVAIMKDTSILAHLTTDNGLLSNAITGLLTTQDILWATTPAGISGIRIRSYSPLKYDIVNIGKNDGLFNIAISQLVQFKGSIYAATSKGLYCIDDPASFIDKKPISIPFYLSAVNYYKGDTSNTDHLSVPYTQNRVRLSMSAICYNMPDSLHYYYRINETENWQQLTGPELLLENLSPGDYKIELKAAIPHLNRSSPIQTFSLTIEKPWWQNNWFRLGMVLLVGGLIFFFIRFRVKKIQHSEEQKRRLNTKMNELKQISLKAQMNPHFIFNCLTSIQQLIVTGDAREANDALVKFSRLIRKTLELSSELYISIAAEKEYLAEYIALEQLRFPNQFTADFVIDETIDTYTTLIPGMLLQPIIENSIRHGVKHLQERKGRIIITIRKQENTIVCTVRDNGTGRDSSGANATSHKSYGTRIIQQRLDNLAELEGINSISLEIKDLKDGDIIAGTEVLLRLPYKSTTK